MGGSARSLEAEAAAMLMLVLENSSSWTAIVAALRKLTWHASMDARHRAPRGSKILSPAAAQTERISRGSFTLPLVQLRLRPRGMLLSQRRRIPGLNLLALAAQA